MINTPFSIINIKHLCVCCHLARFHKFNVKCSAWGNVKKQICNFAKLWWFRPGCNFIELLKPRKVLDIFLVSNNVCIISHKWSKRNGPCIFGWFPFCAMLLKLCRVYRRESAINIIYIPFKTGITVFSEKKKIVCFLLWIKLSSHKIYVYLFPPLYTIGPIFGL